MAKKKKQPTLAAWWDIGLDDNFRVFCPNCNKICEETYSILWVKKMKTTVCWHCKIVLTLKNK